MPGRLRIPAATYRLQFNKRFRLRDAAALAAYLSRLGITDIYASPVLKARKGSSHGYDITNPTRLNPELGTEEDFDSLSEALRHRDMGLLLDIVPNHMAATPENPWWRHYEKNGKDSPYAAFFDTGWLDYKGTGSQTTGYRRFFDVGELVGVRVEDPQVFEATHAYIFKLIHEGKVTGLRIDHIDGLYDPVEYLSRLQRRIGPQAGGHPGFYVIVEKILSGDESLPVNWPVFGTTGYDFAMATGALFVDGDGIKLLNNIYSYATGLQKSFRALVNEKKKQVIRELFPEEIKALGRYLAQLSEKLDAAEACRALTEVTAYLPVYRTYIRDFTVAGADREYVEKAFYEAANCNAEQEAALNFLRRVLLLDFPAGITPDDKSAWLNFVMRWQQFTGAVMAKGFEDTALYNYHRLVSLNEVGGEPDTGGLSIEGFNRWNRARMERWPHTMNADSTHDTKRSEDVRARISVLSEIPEEWERHLKRWQARNRVNKTKAGGLYLPEPNTEILIYQTLIGAWPLFPDEVPEFKVRLKDYMIKAVREAKAITGWLKVNDSYEDSLSIFIDAILKNSADNRFLQDFLKLEAKVAYCGALSSLSRLLLKIASPGVPDFYQGTELWDFSLVDPDNRRPVNLKKRIRMLDAMLEREAAGEAPPVKDMLASWQDGRVKLYIIYKALNARRTLQNLFKDGDYLPLNADGEMQEFVCAFARHYHGEWAVVTAPRFFTKLSEAGRPPLGERAWRKTRIILPEDAPQKWRNIFTGGMVRINSGGNALSLADILKDFPVAMLIPSS